METAVRLTSVSKLYDSFTAVNGVNLQIACGETLGLIGHNGAGKTTTLKMMAGLVSPTSGSVEVMGRDMARDAVEAKKHIGYLPEESPLYENMRVKEYLLFFSELYRMPRAEAEGRIDLLLDSLKLPERDKYTGELSKGMRRKVAIARTLLHDPSLLILDEPDSGLDPLTSFFIISYLRKLGDQGKTIVLSAHNLFHIEHICHRVGIMKNGQLILCDSMEAIRQRFGSRDYEVVFQAKAELPGYEKQGDSYVFRTADAAKIGSLLQEISDRGWVLIDLSVRQSALEDIYVKLMEDPDQAPQG